jgi:hypothetical protein
MTYSSRKWTIALAALGLSLAAGSAQAAGVPLPASQACGMQYYQIQMSGTLLAKVSAGSSGSYHLTLSRDYQGSEVIADVSGPVASRGRGEIELARVLLTQRDFVPQAQGPGSRQPFGQARDSYGVSARLEVFNRAGRRTCVSESMTIFPAAAMFVPRPDRAMSPLPAQAAPGSAPGEAASFRTPARAALQPRARQPH